ncbi:MAG: hypothetical protein RIR70_1103 [Pseudomonadota bacterium]|jgi:YVTN family beta-propeller protein
MLKTLLFLLTACITALPGAASAEIAVALNADDATVSLIDTTTYKEIGQVPVGKEPHHLMPTPDDKELLVAAAMSNELIVLDPKTGQVLRRIKQISDPYQIGFSPDKKWFVSISLRLDRVDIYRAQDYSLVARIPAPKAPSHVTFDADSNYAFVTLQNSGEIMAIDLKTHKEAWKMRVGPTPAGIWMTPDEKHLLVGIMGADFVRVVDWRNKKLVSYIRTAPGAHNFQALGDGKHVLVSNRVANSISIIDQEKLALVETFPVPGGPDCMEVRRDGKELWVTSRFARKVHVIDLATKQIKHAINVGRSPHGVYFMNHAPRR